MECHRLPDSKCWGGFTVSPNHALSTHTGRLRPMVTATLRGWVSFKLEVSVSFKWFSNHFQYVSEQSKQYLLATVVLFSSLNILLTYIYHKIFPLLSLSSPTPFTSTCPVLARQGLSLSILLSWPTPAWKVVLIREILNAFIHILRLLVNLPLPNLEDLLMHPLQLPPPSLLVFLLAWDFLSSDSAQKPRQWGHLDGSVG